MITQVLHCPYCQGTDIVRHGTRRLKASNAIAAVRASRDVGARFSWTMPTPVNRLT